MTLCQLSSYQHGPGVMMGHMDPTVLYIFGSVLLVSAISLIGVFTISINAAVLKRCIIFLIALAAGALLGDAFIHLIPESIEEIGGTQAALFVLGGIVLFFILEKLLRWHHHHDTEHDHVREEPLGPLVITADIIHNLIDGIIIAASFLISIPLGIATTIAVALHELPQEISDFALLIHAGYTRVKALILNFVSALFAVIGALLVLLFANVESAVPSLIALTAGGFIYIAGTDLVPELQKRSDVRASVVQLIGFLIGIAVMFLLLLFE